MNRPVLTLPKKRQKPATQAPELVVDKPARKSVWPPRVSGEAHADLHNVRSAR